MNDQESFDRAHGVDSAWLAHLCLTCRYWEATIGDQCEACASPRLRAVVEENPRKVSAVHDTLRQATRAIMSELDGLLVYDGVDDTIDNDVLAPQLAAVALAVFMADPVVRRAFATTAAVDNEPLRRWDQDAEYGISNDFNCGWNDAIVHFRAAGNTT